MAGNSGSPLMKKLGIKEGDRVLLVNAPANYFQLIGQLPKGAMLVSGNQTGLDFIHLFVNSMEELELYLPTLKIRLHSNGTFWISWHKKTSGIATDVTEELIRKSALSLGLVDIKVSAVDDKWSGLKFVIRKGNRK
ncbi:MAG: DUF3052 domain-containing protein [Chitinophagaceae bacterium]|nr:DUF3052 domain-containing protein [Chitinophagaceae bacterium]